MSARPSRNVTGIRQRRKEGHPWPPGRPEGGALAGPCAPLHELHQPGDAPCWEDSARRPGFSERPEGVLWDSPGRDVSTTPPHRSGRVVDAADGPQSPLVASLLPLAVRAGALALAGVGRGPVTARPDPQAVGALSMILPLLGFVRGDAAARFGPRRCFCLAAAARPRRVGLGALMIVHRSSGKEGERRAYGLAVRSAATDVEGWCPYRTSASCTTSWTSREDTVSAERMPRASSASPTSTPAAGIFWDGAPAMPRRAVFSTAPPIAVWAPDGRMRRSRDAA